MDDQRYNVWFARGFTARARSVDFPGTRARKVPGYRHGPDPSVVADDREVDFKNDSHRRQAFLEGFQWCGAVMSHNLVPYTPEEILRQERRYWARVKGVAKV